MTLILYEFVSKNFTRITVYEVHKKRTTFFEKITNFLKKVRNLL
jgi:hypothetical protein